MASDLWSDEESFSVPGSPLMDQGGSSRGIEISFDLEEGEEEDGGDGGSSCSSGSDPLCRTFDSDQVGHAEQGQEGEEEICIIYPPSSSSACSSQSVQTPTSPCTIPSSSRGEQPNNHIRRRSEPDLRDRGRMVQARMTGHERIISFHLDQSWSNVKRSLSLGSRSKLGYTGRRSNGILNLDEIDDAQRSQGIMGTSSTPASTLIQHGSGSTPSSTVTGNPVDRDAREKESIIGDEDSSEDDHWSLDDHSVALKLFPRPPDTLSFNTARLQGDLRDNIAEKTENKDDPALSIYPSERIDCLKTLPSDVVITDNTSSPSSPSFNPPEEPIGNNDQKTSGQEERPGEVEESGPLNPPPLASSTENNNNPLLTPIPLIPSFIASDTSPTTTVSSSDSIVENTLKTPKSDRERIMGWDSDPEVTPPSASTTLPAHTSSKPTPTIPSSTRTSSILSTPNQDSILSSPATTYTTLSRRQSKFTAFSGSSASSIHSLESSCSLRQDQQGGLPWSGKPDISTVFEVSEGDSLNSFDVEHTHKPVRSGDKLIDQKTTDQSSKDLDPQGYTTSIPPLSQRLIQQTSLPSLPPLPLINQISPVRNNRSGTITSQSSSVSARSKTLPHPFASINLRPTSPLAVPTLKSENKPILSSSRSSPNLVDTYRMQAMSVPSPAHQVTLAEEVQEDGDKCPVCHESLSSEFRLAGEKPLVIAECGHEVHYACFEMCYGEVPSPGSRKQIGVCGICRQPMRVAEGGRRKNKKSNKLAMLAGLDPDDNPFAPRNRTFNPAVSISSDRASVNDAEESTADDPLVPLPLSLSTSSRSIASDMQPNVVVPSITVRSEYTSVSKIHRGNKGHFMTTMVTISVPPAGNRGKYPAAVRPLDLSAEKSSPRLPPSPRSDETPAKGNFGSARSESGAFAHIIRDLENRVSEYRQSGLDTIGPLRLFDILSVRKGSMMREFNVYLFQEALICITEEKKSGIRSFFSGSSSRSESSSGKTVTLASGRSGQGRGALRLKGRIYLRHVARIVDSSTIGELSLTIVMTDEGMDPFILVFRERGSHGLWKRNLETIVREIKGGHTLPNTAPPVPNFPGNSSKKIAQMMGNDVTVPRSASVPSRVTHTYPSTASTATSFGEMMRSPSSAGYSATTPATSAFAPGNLTSQELTSGDLVYNAPLAPVHTPIDLVVILSLPALSAASGQPAGSQMKNKIMRQTLAFTLASMGPRDRVAFVSAEQGAEGVIRKTPFLNPTRFKSRQRLESFIDVLGNGRIENTEFEVDTSSDERIDVVTAMNVALDVVLQRKARNTLGAMVVISDSVENIKRSQMDLVTARLDAANITVHSIGYGKGHDPSPLWMFSNHTHATYTFVKDWYDLQKAMAGVLGGLTSIAITNMKLHVACTANEYKVVRVGGVSESIISQGGREVEVDLREMRFGETRELLIEVDLANPAPPSPAQRYSGESGSSDPASTHLDPVTIGSGSRSAGSSNGMDGAIGIEGLSMSESQRALNDAIYESATIDEEPVYEVNCSYHDPSANRSVTRLVQPVLLVVAVFPSSANSSTTPSDPSVIRRRMEVLASDMITRSLLIASRKNLSQATRVLTQTKTIIVNMIDRMRGMLSPLEGSNRMATKREMGIMNSLEGLEAVLSDLDALIDGLLEQPELFERDARNFAAQQAIVLRTQKSWMPRCGTQAIYMGPGARELVNLSAGWKGGR